MKHAVILFAFILFLTALAVAAPSAEKEEMKERISNFRGDRRERRQAPQGRPQGPIQGLPGPQGVPCTGRRCGPAELGRIRGRVIIQEGPFDRGFHAGSDADED